MVAYSLDAAPETSVKAKGEALKIHFKNVVNVAQAVKHMTLRRAKQYLENVLEHKEIVAMNSHKHGRGRHAQAKNVNAPGSLSGWPRNATKEMLSLLKNAEATAKGKGLDKDDELLVSSVVCNMAQKGRRRTYRAHGRIGPYMSTPSHVNIILKQKTKTVPKPKETAATQHKLKHVARGHGAKRQAAGRVAVGGGAE